MTTLHLIACAHDLPNALAVATADDRIAVLPTAAALDIEDPRLVVVADTQSDTAISWAHLVDLSLEHDRVMSW